MSATQFFVNETANTMFLGGRMIPPGEGRDVPVMFLPATHRPEPVEVRPAEPSMDELLLELLGHSVKHVVGQLPNLSEEAFQRLEMLAGEEEQPRKTLLAAIGEERVRRADERFQVAMDEELARQMAALSPEERAALGEGAAAEGAGADEGAGATAGGGA